MTDRSTDSRRPEGGFPPRFLDGTSLKLLACACMVLDHAGDSFFPEQVWMRILGRMALPLFAFCLAEGFAHTRDRGRYLKRMGLFALISEVPFDLVTSGRILELTHQNIMLTFFWALLGLSLFERLREKGTRPASAGAFVLLAFFSLFSLPLGMDYHLLGTGLVFLFYLLRRKALPVRLGCGALFHILLRNVGIYWFGLLGFVPLLFYNGRRGRGLKWFFYVFYPAHLLLIWAVRGLL